MKRKFFWRKAGLFVCLLLLFSALAGCGAKEPEPEEPPAEENPLDAGTFDSNGNLIKLAWYPDAKMNSLDDAKWIHEDGFMVYQGSGYRTHKAIDVSSNQGEIDWEAVKAAGVEYAIVRAGYRTYGGAILTKDELCLSYLEGAKEAGIKVGVYFFSQAVDTEEAEEEARFTLDILEGMDLDLPIYCDTEEITYDTARTDHLSGEQLTQNALAFCKVIKQAGYTPGIYGNQMWLCNKMDLMELEEYDIWVAKYTEELNYPYELQAWQYSSEGRVEGIDTVVDLDVIIEKE